MKPHRVYTLFRNLTFAWFPAVLTLFSGVSSEWNASMWAGKSEPKRYLAYENLRGNGGGIRLVFDLDTGILCGSYSSN